jgi:DNA-binding PadR family transcriptional regulator
MSSSKEPPNSTRDRLGEFEQLALLSVLQLGNDAYGGQILEQLEARAERSASLSSVYITLTRLEKKGLVSSRMGQPTEERGGKAKRFFRVEPSGIEALQESRDRLIRMWTGLEGVLDRSVATRGA